MGIKNKIVIILVVFVLVNFIIYVAVDSSDDSTEEEKIKQDIRLALEEIKEEEQYAKFNPPVAEQIEQMKRLPESCKGVFSMELDLYPTGEECFSALNKRVEEWCYSDSDGHEGLTKYCIQQFYLKLANTCEDPVLSSIEVCLMNTFQDVYPKLVP